MYVINVGILWNQLKNNILTIFKLSLKVNDMHSKKYINLFIYSNLIYFKFIFLNCFNKFNSSDQLKSNKQNYS